MEDDQEYDQQISYDDEEEDEITQEDAWAVISAYFEEKGLVRQQLDSFDEFIQNTMQEIVDESADIEIRPESQHNPGHQSDFAEVRFSWRISGFPIGITLFSLGTNGVLGLLGFRLINLLGDEGEWLGFLLKFHFWWKFKINLVGSFNW